VFIVLLAVVSAVTLTLFYRQATGSTARYHSDMEAYILEMQGLNTKYSFPYPVFFKLGALIHLFAPPELAMAVATMLLNSLAMVVTKLAFNHIVLRGLESRFALRQEKSGEGKQAPKYAERAFGAHNVAASGVNNNGVFAKPDVSWLAGVLVSVASLSLFFISMVFPPPGVYLPGIKFNYLGVFSANPFHNATYMAARPFAILAFLWYVKLLPVYERGIGRLREEGDACGIGVTGRDYILFSVFLLIATMTKPSFTLVMVSTAGLVMLYRLIRAKFRNFIPTVQLGVCFIPTFLDLLYQYKGVFMPEEGDEGGVGFCFGEVWAQYCSNIPLAVCLAIGFPLLVLLLHYRECKQDARFRFSWQFYLVGFAEAFLLYEKGFRKFDFNFSWGYMYGIFFCHFCALLMLLQETAGRGRSSAECPSCGIRRGKSGTFLFLLQWFAYLCHLICGLFYFKTIFGGAMYY